MASIKILNIFIIIILSKDLYGFPKADFKKRVNILQVKTIYKPDSEFKLNVVLNKHNRTHEAITGNVTLSEDIGNKFHLALEVEIWGDGGWKRNLIHYEKEDPCTQLKFLLGSMWKRLVENANVTANCPTKKGFYVITNYYIDASSVPLIFAPGRVKSIVIITKNQKFVLRFEIIAEIIALYT